MVIYCLENKINGKKYIGKTINKNPLKYIKTHFSNAKLSKDKARSVDGRGKYLYNAIRKYGKENFNISIVAECLSLEELNKTEKELIIKYQSYSPNGYNIAKGGDGGNTRLNMTEEQIEIYNAKIQKAIKERTTKKEVRKQMSDSSKKLWENPKYREKMLKILRDPENIKKRSEKLKLTVNSEEFKLKIKWNKERKEGNRHRVREDWQDKAKREKRIANLKKAANDPEVIKKRVASYKKNYANNNELQELIQNKNIKNNYINSILPKLKIIPQFLDKTYGTLTCSLKVMEYFNTGNIAARKILRYLEKNSYIKIDHKFGKCTYYKVLKKVDNIDNYKKFLEFDIWIKNYKKGEY